MKQWSVVCGERCQGTAAVVLQHLHDVLPVLISLTSGIKIQTLPPPA